jgi:hypothetical protein
MRACGPTMAKLVDQVDQRGTIGPLPGETCIQETQAVVDQRSTLARVAAPLVPPEQLINLTLWKFSHAGEEAAALLSSRR